jgi:hypothetical protein
MCTFGLISRAPVMTSGDPVSPPLTMSGAGVPQPRGHERVGMARIAVDGRETLLAKRAHVVHVQVHDGR